MATKPALRPCAIYRRFHRDAAKFGSIFHARPSLSPASVQPHAEILMRHWWVWDRRTSVTETLRACGFVLPLDARSFLRSEAGHTEPTIGTRDDAAETAQPPYALAPAVKFLRGA
ncbi:MAG TPA: hypothetical protein VMB81_31295 [Candidatus Sulfotelmatobacter sp.]|nr:hypothetical protein [Candidatus Sulfotelmatobacter sp.]